MMSLRSPMALDTSSLVDESQLDGILNSINTELNLISSEYEDTPHDITTYKDLYDFSGF